MIKEDFMEVKSLVKAYSDAFKVEDDSVPSSPDSSMFRSTLGGWIQAANDERYGYIIKRGSLFPEDKFLEVVKLLSTEWDIALREGSCGTNWTPYYMYVEGQRLRIK